MVDQSEAASLKRQRTTIKASCTRIRTYVDTITAITSSVIIQLEERKIKLEYYWSQYYDVQSRLESFDEAEGADRGGFEEAFYALSSRIRELVAPSPTSRASASSISSSNARDSDRGTHIRLPKLNLPTFTGKYDEWLPFYDTFNAAIHSNTSLSDTQRFQYLRASLTGDASAVISSLELSDANYDVAWSILKDRYDNKRVIIQSHVKAILDLPLMSKENSVDLRKISDGTSKHLHALQALKRPIAHWDDILISILTSKLDSLTIREWENSLTGNELPTLKQLVDFIAHRSQVLEATARASTALARKAESKSQPSAKRASSCAATVKPRCHFCQGDHAIYYCKKFVALPVSQRAVEIRSRKLCANCLRSSSHASNKCTSGQCKVCHAKHNTLLHMPAAADASTDKEATAKADAPSSILATHTSGSVSNEQVMLSTAVVYVCDNEGSDRACRALLDCGSQANFISRKLVQDLGLKTRPLNVSISGVNGTVATSHHVTQIKLQSRVSSYTAVIECIIVDQVTDKIPAVSTARDIFKFPRNIRLADPRFNISSDIDLLIGVELFWSLICVGQVKSSDDHPTLQKTRLGWILAGRLGAVTAAISKVHSFHASISNAELHEHVSRAWQMENISSGSDRYTMEEGICERHFMDNVSQNSQGRYTVKLPIKEHALGKIGDSRDAALKRLKRIERRFKRDPALKIQYAEFVKEYISLGHMRRLEPPITEEPASFYLPHHCVFKIVGQTSKIRVVFDASCRSTTGVSLNDVLLVGPNVQQDLISILLRFRYFLYVITADIIKMYRQISMHPSQTRLQRILWRDDPSMNVDTYELTTVTYGTASASFLATRCLKHLAEQHAFQFPRGSACVLRNFYVDEMLAGADAIDELKLIRDETNQLLKLGAFELSKWASNTPELLEADNRDCDPVEIKDKPTDSYILVSKRTILSQVAKWFDPLGLLGPIIVVARLILQDLWQLSIQWDESVPQDIHTRWIAFRAQMETLNQLRIPRCVKSEFNQLSLEIHGFCDASERAFGACIYLRTELEHNEYRSTLLCSKSRVAPLRAVSLPRLELSAALLLARLIDKVKNSLECSQCPIYLWSDSTIALNWITSPSRRWSTFVANRVGEIQRLTEIGHWRHITSAHNPADILSRRLAPGELINAESWWSGPNFLKRDEQHWPPSVFVRLENDLPEQRKLHVTASISYPCVVSGLLNKYSNLDKICRIIAYCLRLSKAHRAHAVSDFVSPVEISAALICICKAVQRRSFHSEYQALDKNGVINTSSSILSLSPFLDRDGLIRVGGRLKNSNLSFDACHPALLPRKHILTQRVIEREHLRNLHAGLQATMAFVRQRFWPLSLRSTTRGIIQKCTVCFKAKPKCSEAVMGFLPASRVNVSRPFSHCGVDYAGPLLLREGRRRNSRNHKSYLSIFVCFATKAVHLELVSNLTSEAFIAAFKRFISRRGKPLHMYSDNGTTFVGAQRQIQELYDVYNDPQVQSEIKYFLRDSGISWSFIPPNAPHFGGLWEAAVKSAKYHIARIVGKAHLTFEEMQTTLCEIEAILNSRPLAPLSTDPNDLAYLSPGHFLVGTALNGLPCSDLSNVSENRLLRCQRVEQIRQHFWSRWSNEYLHTLQARTKWMVNKGNQLSVGQPVLMRQQGVAPLQWAMGRVQEVHPGPDGITRTATIKTAKGLYVRPLSKLAILPIAC